MVLSILCFGIVKDFVKADVIEFNLDAPYTVTLLRTKLESKYQKLSDLKSYLIAVNQEIANDDTKIKEGDELAIIPPVSGG